MSSPSRRVILFAVAVVAVVTCAGLGFGYYHHEQAALAASAAQSAETAYKTPEEADVFVRFDMEVYDIVQKNHWQKASDADLSALYQLALQKVTNAPAPPALATSTRAGTATMLAAAFAQASSTEAKRELAKNEAMAVLYNLAPAGRSGLMSQAQQTALAQEVNNVHPDTDLYQDLNLTHGASAQDVAAAYARKKQELTATTSPDAKQALAKAQYAHDVLSDSTAKSRYDAAKIEPTIFGRVLGKTLYVNMTQVSPASLQEFAQAIDHASTTPHLDSLIVDLRGNIGGSLDFAPAFLGLFIGQNQYAFDLFHQGDLQVQRTTQGIFPELVRFGDVAFLVDNMTQSTAELTAAEFKKFRLARVVGASATRGWGTVESTSALTTDIDPSQKFAVLLVQFLTMREDNQPIQDHGVEPNINTSQAGWQSRLSKEFSSSSIISALTSIATKPPLK